MGDVIRIGHGGGSLNAADAAKLILTIHHDGVVRGRTQAVVAPQTSRGVFAATRIEQQLTSPSPEHDIERVVVLVSQTQRTGIEAKIIRRIAPTGAHDIVTGIRKAVGSLRWRRPAGAKGGGIKKISAEEEEKGAYRPNSALSG